MKIMGKDKMMKPHDMTNAAVRSKIEKKVQVKKVKYTKPSKVKRAFSKFYGTRPTSVASARG